MPAWSTFASSAGLVGVGWALTSLTSGRQFRRQQAVEHTRWIRERRFDAYATLSQTVRSSQDLEETAREMEDGQTWHGSIVRDAAPTTLSAASSTAKLVAGHSVSLELNRLNLILWVASQDGAMSVERLSSLASIVEDLEHAMRLEVDQYLPEGFTIRDRIRRRISYYRGPS